MNTVIEVPFHTRCLADVMMERFVTFQTHQQAPVTPATQENTMNDHYSEHQTLLRAAREATDAHIVASMKHHHITGDRPSSTTEAIEWFQKGYVEKPEHKDGWDRKLDQWEGPFDYVRFRKHQADKDGHETTQKKILDARKDLDLDIAILPPTEALEKLRAFKSKTFH